MTSTLDPDYSDNSATYREKQMHPIRAEILDAAKRACDRFGGAANVDGSYWFVDTAKYRLEPVDGS